MDGAVARKPVQHFLMSVVRLKTLFWEIGSKTSSDHLTHPETGATLIYATSAINPKRTLPRTLRPSVSRKGDGVCSNVPRNPRPRPKP
ncbi:hypothetical protein TNIN_210781 [Trichonephila inaurata madagascariensis]|uniref:Uncharacterized protein n=1 Tax=Trichonephila inaurata madagascariensis TaxID=2747483 RepID=A0A8X7CMN7_9ARAC|nr:hypothetical protein TNIN_210781 [Trichonephila inaurata madagascariensis]